MQLLSTLFLSLRRPDRRPPLCLGAGSANAKGDLAGAAELLQQALELTPGYASAWFALGELREKLGDRPAPPRPIARRARPTRTDRHGALVNLMRIGAAAPADMPPVYVRTLFDHYAPDFDRSLTEGLNYSAPGIAAEGGGGGGGRHALCRHARSRLRHRAGGRGVPRQRRHACRCRSVAAHGRAGAAKNIYDRLEVGDLLEFLAGEKDAGNAI